MIHENGALKEFCIRKGGVGKKVGINDAYTTTRGNTRDQGDEVGDEGEIGMKVESNSAIPMTWASDTLLCGETSVRMGGGMGSGALGPKEISISVIKGVLLLKGELIPTPKGGTPIPKIIRAFSGIGTCIIQFSQERYQGGVIILLLDLLKTENIGMIEGDFHENSEETNGPFERGGRICFRGWAG